MLFLGLALGLASDGISQEASPLGRIQNQRWVSPCRGSCRFQQRMTLHDLRLEVEETGLMTLYWRDKRTAVLEGGGNKEKMRIQAVDMEDGAQGVHVIGEKGFREEIVLARTGWLYITVKQEEGAPRGELRVPFIEIESELGPLEEPSQENGPWIFRYGQDRLWRLVTEGSTKGHLSKEPWGWRCSLSSEEGALSFVFQLDPFLVARSPVEASSLEPTDLLSAGSIRLERSASTSWRWRVRHDVSLLLEAELKEADPLSLSLWRRGPDDLGWVRLDDWEGQPLRTATPLQGGGNAWTELEARLPEGGDVREALSHLRLAPTRPQGAPVSEP